jgi:hypothetical protein
MNRLIIHNISSLRIEGSSKAPILFFAFDGRRRINTSQFKELWQPAELGMPNKYNYWSRIITQFSHGIRVLQKIPTS